MDTFSSIGLLKKNESLPHTLMEMLLHSKENEFPFTIKVIH